MAHGERARRRPDTEVDYELRHLATGVGQARSEAQMRVRLRGLSIQARPRRARALIHLAQRLKAPLLARGLDLHPTTAQRWYELAGRPYSGYVAHAARSHTHDH